MKLPLRFNPLIILLTTLTILFSSCEKEDPDAIAERDREKLEEYIKENGLEDVAIAHESGLFYVVENPGTGVHPTVNSTIRIRYTGKLLDGKVFDESSGALLQLGGTIMGWQIGIPLFKTGGKGKLLIPSALGYGAYPPYGGTIPRHACLIFDFEIMDVAN